MADVLLGGLAVRRLPSGFGYRLSDLTATAVSLGQAEAWALLQLLAEDFAMQLIPQPPRQHWCEVCRRKVSDLHIQQAHRPEVSDGR